MTPETLGGGADLVILGVSIGAGLLGALGGVGGGLIIVPALIILFGIDIQLAAGASIVAVIATSSGAAATFVREGLANLRIGMFLELATTTGAVVGALLAGMVAPSLLMGLLGVILLGSAGMQLLRLGDPPGGDQPPAPGRLRLVGEYHSVRLQRTVPYGSRHVPLGVGVMWLAGIVSGMLGIGSGALKVLAMDGVMRLPMKVSSATSNFMIGVTAAASAGIYLARGDVDATLAAPVAVGVLIGAIVGSRLLPRLSNRTVRLVFTPVLALIAVELLLRAAGVRI
ncbi:MAG: sulfite exporter TauE/SafE family protein [Chloroflexota bacterium]